MKRRTEKAQRRAARKATRASQQLASSGRSAYGRKKAYIRDASRRDANLGRQLAKEQGVPYESERPLFGFDFPEPKPWRS
jgi:hypothetical protein